MSDSVTLDMNSDGTISCEELGLRVMPPGRMEIRSDGSGPAYIALFMGGKQLTPELIEQMIDFYGLINKGMAGMRIVIGTG